MIVIIKTSKTGSTAIDTATPRVSPYVLIDTVHSTWIVGSYYIPTHGIDGPCRWSLRYFVTHIE